MIPAEELLKLLEERDLVPPEVIQQLRRRAAESARSPKPFSAAMAAKTLVDQGYLSRLLAQRLMAAVEKTHAEKDQRQRPEPIVLKKVEPPAKKKSGSRDASAEEENLELAPLDDTDDLFGTPSRRKAPARTEAETRPPGKDISGAAVGKAAGSASEAASSVPQSERTAAGPEVEGLPRNAIGSGTDDLFADLSLPIGATSAGPMPNPFAAASRRRNVWDSPLLLLSGGALLLVIFVGVVVLFSLNRRSGDELLAEADADYRSGSYTQAIHKYQRFLEDFPKHPQAGITRVRVGLAQMRQTLGGDWLETWQNTKRILQEIAVLPDFHPEADPELTAILPQIGEGLASSAFERADAARIEAAEQVLSAIRRYVPRENRPSKKIADIENSLQLARRRIALNEEHAKALGQIREARARNAVDDAYEIRRQLVRQFPQLAADQELSAEMLGMCDWLQATVTMEDIPVEPLKAEPERKVEETAFYAVLREGQAPAGDDQFVLVEAEDCVFCVRATNGDLVWQRYMGAAMSGGVPPTPLPQVAADGGRAAVLLDHRRHALVWIDLATGKELRSIKIPGETVWGPRLAGQSILVGGNDSRLYVADAAGQRLWVARFPLSVKVPPAVAADPGDAASPWFVAADHSYVFVLNEAHLNEAQRKVAGVIYTGHDRGELVLPPVAMSGYLLLPEVLGNDASRISVWRWGDAQEPAVVQQVSIDGRLAGPLLVSANRLLFETARHDVVIFELRGDPKSPLVRLAEGKTASPDTAGANWELPSYALLQGGVLIAADISLTRFDLQAAAGRLIPQWVTAENCPVVQQPQIVGETVYHAYRRTGQSGVYLAAIGVKEGAFYWEIRLADPWSDSPEVKEGAIRMTTVSGAVCSFEIGPGKEHSPSLPTRLTTVPGEDQGAASSLGSSEVLYRVPLPSPAIEARAWEGEREISIQEDGVGGMKVRRMMLPHGVAGPLVVRDQRLPELVVPLRNGCLAVVDWTTGRWVGDPYQTAVRPGVPVKWTCLAALPNHRIAAVRDNGRMWLLSVGDDGWRAEHEITLSSPLVPPLAVLQNHVFAMDRQRRLTAVNYQSGEVRLSEALDDRTVWGPCAVENRVWIGTARGQFQVWDDQPARVVVGDSVGMPWLGTPVTWRNHLLSASLKGEVVLWDSRHGTILDRVPLAGIPATGPTIWQDWLVVGMRDGRTLRLRLDQLTPEKLAATKRRVASP